jgi:hypothetical protein
MLDCLPPYGSPAVELPIDLHLMNASVPDRRVSSAAARGRPNASA